MNDAIVSIRLPTALIKELKDQAKKNHYMDLSEQLRDIIRQKSSQYLKPALRPQPVEPKKDLDEKKQMIEDLQNIIKELKKGL